MGKEACLNGRYFGNMLVRSRCTQRAMEYVKQIMKKDTLLRDPIGLGLIMTLSDQIAHQ